MIVRFFLIKPGQPDRSQSKESNSIAKEKRKRQGFERDGFNFFLCFEKQSFEKQTQLMTRQYSCPQCVEKLHPLYYSCSTHSWHSSAFSL
jgi:hypothetical protein